MTALFIVNELSEGVTRKGSVLETVAKDENIRLHFLGDFGGLADEVQKAARDNVSHIFIEGGDGTVHGVMTEFMNRKSQFKTFPVFSIVSGGMTNQVAKNIGVKPSKPTRVRDILVKKNLRFYTTPLLKVISEGYPSFYGFLFSSGAVPLITQYTKSKLHHRGIGGSMAVLGGILRGVSNKRDGFLYPTDIDLEIDDLSLSENHLGTLVTTLPGLILGLDPFWGTQKAPLRVTYVDGAVKGLNRQVIGLWLGNKRKDRSASGMKSWNAGRVKYNYNGPIVLDGEPISFPSGQFEIRATEPVEFVY